MGPEQGRRPAACSLCICARSCAPAQRLSPGNESPLGLSDLIQVCPERKARNIVDFPRAAPQETSVLVYVRERANLTSYGVDTLFCLVV